MRAIRFSRTFNVELAALLRQGVPGFGTRVVASSREKVFRTIESYIAPSPVRAVDPVLGICAYHVKATPFVLLYDYDDTELRIHLINYAKADRAQIDLSAVEWC